MANVYNRPMQTSKRPLLPCSLRLLRIGLLTLLVWLPIVASGDDLTSKTYLDRLPTPDQVMADFRDVSDVKRVAKQLAALVAMADFIESREPKDTDGDLLNPEARRMRADYLRAHDALWKNSTIRFVQGSELWKAFYRLYLTYEKNPDFVLEVVPRHVGAEAESLRAQIERDREYFAGTAALSGQPRGLGVVDRYGAALGAACFVIFLAGSAWQGRRLFNRANLPGYDESRGVGSLVAGRLLDVIIIGLSAAFLVLGLYLVLR